MTREQIVGEDGELLRNQSLARRALEIQVAHKWSASQADMLATMEVLEQEPLIFRTVGEGDDRIVMSAVACVSPDHQYADYLIFHREGYFAIHCVPDYGHRTFSQDEVENMQNPFKLLPESVYCRNVEKLRKSVISPREEDDTRYVAKCDYGNDSLGQHVPVQLVVEKQWLANGLFRKKYTTLDSESVGIRPLAVEQAREMYNTLDETVKRYYELKGSLEEDQSTLAIQIGNNEKRKEVSLDDLLEDDGESASGTSVS